MKVRDSMSGIVTAAMITVRPDKRKELFLTISSLLDQIRNEEGCLGYRFYGEASEQDSFLIVGEWETKTDLDRHIHSDHFSVLRGSMEVLGIEDSLNFTVLSSIGGLDEFRQDKQKLNGA